MNLFQDDPNTKTDDFVYRLAALSDLISTLSGATVAIVGAVVPTIILLTPGLPNEIKLASVAGGTAITAGGTFIARQQPKGLRDLGSAYLNKVVEEPDDMF